MAYDHLGIFTNDFKTCCNLLFLLDYYRAVNINVKNMVKLIHYSIHSC